MAGIAAAIALLVVVTSVAAAGPANARDAQRGHGTTTTTAPKVTTSTTVAASTTTTAAPRVTTTTSTTTPRVTTTTPPATTSTTVAPSGSGSGSGSILWGAATPSLANLKTFNTDAGKPVSLDLYYDSWADDANFDAAGATAIRNLGATPLLTWEPWDPNNGSVDQPAYSLSNIASGAYDSYITTWAQEIKAWGQPLWLRFAHEMNGNWYPWGDGVNGNTPAEYVAAYQHVHNIFTAVGATNVTWVWTPNVDMGTTPLSQFYPGNAYVDWIGMDGYNWGTTQSWGSTWQTPTEVFGQTLAELQALTSKPIIIDETASAEQGGNKAQWIQQFFSMLGSTPSIKAFVWFDYNKETDWRIESSSAAQSAFAAGIANSRYISG